MVEGADGVNLGDDDARALAAKGLGAALADVAVAADDGDLAGDHHVHGAVEAVHEGVAAAVEVVELRLGGGVVDVDGGDEKFALLKHLVEAVDAGGGFLGDALPVLHDAVPVAVAALLGDGLEEVLDDFDLVVVGGGVDPAVAVFEFVALVDEECRVAAVVHDEFGSEAVAVIERTLGAPPVFLQGLALPREDGDAGGGDGRSGVVLRGEDVAARPADGRAQGRERLDEHGGLDGHVQRAGDADAFEGLVLGILLADRHEAGHLVLGDVEFLAPPVGEGDVFDFVVGLGGGFLGHNIGG
jgi:hypothetical protein